MCGIFRADINARIASNLCVAASSGESVVESDAGLCLGGVFIGGLLDNNNVGFVHRERTEGETFIVQGQRMNR